MTCKLLDAFDCRSSECKSNGDDTEDCRHDKNREIPSDDSSILRTDQRDSVEKSKNPNPDHHGNHNPKREAEFHEASLFEQAWFHTISPRS